jgi:hypothetical protein
MTDLSPIRSRKYLDGARGQPCTFTGPTCCADPATTVFAHLNGAAFGKGMGQKAHDIAGLDACAECHRYIDTGHGTRPLVSDAEFNMLLLRAVVRTMVNRGRRHIIIIPLDAERLSSSKPTTPRKPPEQRTKIQTRKAEWPSRPMQSANNLRKAGK